MRNLFAAVMIAAFAVSVPALAAESGSGKKAAKEADKSAAVDWKEASFKIDGMT